jgi:3-keto-disaccharide hydrolase
MRGKLIFAFLFLSLQSMYAHGAEDNWVSLFNGKDLNGWTPKFTGYDAGVNYKNTFRVIDGNLSVRYDEYVGFDNNFGHIFYKQKYSNYNLKLEYRIHGEQVPGGPGWGIRNNGIMVHSQSVESMEIDQYFPRSIEVQLLNGGASDERPNGNVCTPGTHIVMDGELITEHCINSNSVTNRGNEWVTAEVEVRGNEIIRHKINGVVVMEYTHPQADAHDSETPVTDLEHLSPISEGFIALQAESHGFDFRNIMLLNLDKD